MSKEANDVVGLLPFDAGQMRELLQIYQNNYADLQESYNQTISFLVLLTMEQGGRIEVPLEKVDAMNTKAHYEIQAQRDDEKGVFVLMAREANGEVSELSDGAISTDGGDGRSDSDSG